MTATAHTSETGLDAVAELAAQLRVDSIRSSTSAGSGHPTSSMSAADLLAVLVTRHLRYDWDDPHLPANDHLIFSKGHASPLLYSVFKAAGVVSEEELMTGYRRFGQRLQGHPTPVLPWVDVATGSLGQGLPDGVGVALAGKYLDRQPNRVWVLCGDSELAEGSIWEALDKASYYQLSNLIAIADVNRLGQRGETDLGWNLDAYARRAEAFGARVLVIDGHDLAAIDDALATAGDTAGQQPTVILAKTVKGRGFSEVETAPTGTASPSPPTWPTGRSPSSAASATWCSAARARTQFPPRNWQPNRQTPARRCRGTPSATGWPPARPTATHWSPSAPGTGRSSRWTQKSATPPTPASSRTHTRSGTSRCSSPNRNSWPPPPGSTSAATARSPRPSPCS
jgi:transketolase N-terminal domain/subunit